MQTIYCLLNWEFPHHIARFHRMGAEITLHWASTGLFKNSDFNLFSSRKCRIMLSIIERDRKLIQIFNTLQSGSFGFSTLISENNVRYFAKPSPSFDKFYKRQYNRLTFCIRQKIKW